METTEERRKRIEEGLQAKLQLTHERKRQLREQQTELEQLLKSAQNAKTLTESASILFRIRAGLDYLAADHATKRPTK